ncbi:hypothetical protein FB451DRAFT_1412506 [Mycena latifolia]|nr:hypothetical protein FB451DRAFT_1412506 [Mycena latifolia]
MSARRIPLVLFTRAAHPSFTRSSGDSPNTFDGRCSSSRQYDVRLLISSRVDAKHRTISSLFY